MEFLAGDKLPEGLGWLYELLCNPQHKNSYVAQEVMLRDNSGSAHLLADALRARNIISTSVKLRSPSRRQKNDCRQPARDCFDECFGLYSSIETDYVVRLMEGDLTGAT